MASLRTSTPPEGTTRGARAARPPGYIDDELATSAIFDMTPEQIMRDPVDPVGVQIGDAVADVVLAELARERRPPLTPFPG